MRTNQQEQSELSQFKLEYERGDDIGFLKLIGQYKTKRRARAARKAKEGDLRSHG
ncbi:hypothetical protein RR21198_4867 [Rhodococcus rhodochrous ATCC 21198]|nr:hypothetical protein RR21198_4867 [Rhodococcus rhodochrous ATCC 21198]